MRSHFVLLILAACVSTCVAEEAACAASGDTGDDHCTLLQGNVGVASKDTKSMSAKHLEEHLDEHHAQGDSVGDALKQLDEHHAQGESEGWPDIFNKVKGLLGGADKLEKDFDGVKIAVGVFKDSVDSDMTQLLKEVKPSMGIYAIRDKVEHTYQKIHLAAKKLWEALEKVTKAWLDGLGKVAPQQLGSAMKSVLDKVSAEGKQFADAFKTASDDLKKVNTTQICHKVKHGLHTVLKKASALAKSATGLSTKGLSKELKEATNMLPDTLKKQIDNVLHKANEAADRILRNLTPSMKEITHGVAKAFGDQCKGIPHSGAGQLKVGLLLTLVLSALSFSM